MKVTEEMVQRFLWWRLPADFSPDCGINFDGRKPDQWNPSKEWPVGTNLLTAIQARAMLEHVLGTAEDCDCPAYEKQHRVGCRFASTTVSSVERPTK